MPLHFVKDYECDKFLFIIHTPSSLASYHWFAAMIVCVCRRVSDREIARLAHQGMDFKGIQRELDVARQCGRCAPCARALVAQCHASRNAPAGLHDDTRMPAMQPATHFSGNTAWPSSSPLLAV